MLIVSPDHFLYDATGTYVWTPARAGWGWKETERIVKEALQTDTVKLVTLMIGAPGAGKSTWLQTHPTAEGVFVDATFCKRSYRTPYVRMATEAGIPIHALVFRTPLSVCVERNRTRTPDRQVPEDRLSSFFEQLRNTPPSLTEGFSSVTDVL